MLNRLYSIALLTACLLLSSCGSNSADSAIDSITITTIVAAPAIATQPAASIVTAGQAATLTVSASGGGTLVYQWRRGGVAIVGATAATYTLAAAASADAGSYDVVVSNSAGSVTSTTATLTLASSSGVPVIVAQPASQSVALGASVTLTVAVRGSGTMAYQWRKNGVTLAGASAVSYTIAIARASDAGSYDVVITNASGSSTSAAAALDVTAAASTTPHSLATYMAAMAFYGTLTAAQQATVQLPWSLDTARKWSNLPAGLVARNGIALGTLSTAQLAAATALVKVALGDTGSSLQSGMQAADDYLAAIGGGAGDGNGNYHVAFLGAPSSTGFWMLQMSGHHLTWNLAYNGSYNGPTPLFLGIEPKASFVVGGVTYDPLLAQRSSMADLGAALVNYPAAQLAGTYADLLFGADGVDASCPRAYEGVTSHGALYSSLSATDQALAQAAIRSYVNMQALDNANTLLGAYLSSEALAQTWVAYAGTGSLTVNGNYLRIEGPRVWIEFSVQRGVVVSNDIHYHTIWRDKFADYGGKCG
ncbi:DUF3500 domain-containing protein [Massilia sp. S19_KUP03_FR1]|uniref:DUF3500 domain-containing protein n=1 Tax=Massilia sp. S19_KUP03_FR1 TaxID=3025503 RepID=UPI002FCCF205